MKADDPIKIVKGLNDASNQEDYEKEASFLADDCVYEPVPGDGVFHGKKGFIDFAKRYHKSFPDHKWELKSVFSDGHRIAAEHVSTGTWTYSNDPKMPATGKHISYRGVSIIELCNGKIYRMTDYYDALSLWQQLGLIPEKPSE